jgi:hypothetical protein
MVIFSINDFQDEQACHDALLATLHPNSLKGPNGHPLPEGQAPHDRRRPPIYDCRCRECGAIYNLFTDTLLAGSHYPCSTWLLLLKGIAQGTPTFHLARETKVSYRNLLRRRHQIQALLELLFPPPIRCPTA